MGPRTDTWLRLCRRTGPTLRLPTWTFSAPSRTRGTLTTSIGPEASPTSAGEVSLIAFLPTVVLSLHRPA